MKEKKIKKSFYVDMKTYSELQELIKYREFFELPVNSSGDIVRKQFQKIVSAFKKRYKIAEDVELNQSVMVKLIASQQLTNKEIKDEPTQNQPE